MKTIKLNAPLRQRWNLPGRRHDVSRGFLVHCAIFGGMVSWLVQNSNLITLWTMPQKRYQNDLQKSNFVLNFFWDWNVTSYNLIRARSSLEPHPLRSWVPWQECGWAKVVADSKPKFASFLTGSFLASFFFRYLKDIYRLYSDPLPFLDFSPWKQTQARQASKEPSEADESAPEEEMESHGGVWN